MPTRPLLNAWNVLRAAIRELGAHDPFRMAGATAFFTSFALPAILIIVVRTLGLFSDQRSVGRHIGGQLRRVLGDESMDSIRQAIRSFRSLQQNIVLSAAIFIFLAFVATTLFKIIKNSINEIWQIRSARHGGMLRMLKSRSISIAVILLGGILFFAVQLIDAGRGMLGGFLMHSVPELETRLGDILSSVVVMLVSGLWFCALFLYLPNGRASTKIVLGGGFITALLFTAGKLVLRSLLSPGRVIGFYGASGALVLVLLFMFYSSLILYFGAALIKAWSDAAGRPIVPKAHANRFRTEIEQDERAL